MEDGTGRQDRKIRKTAQEDKRTIAKGRYPFPIKWVSPPPREIHIFP